MSKIVILCGSVRRGGNTETLARAFAEGGIHEAIADYEDAVFFDILAEELARRDMDDAAIDESNFAELTRRMDAYMAEFEAHGTDHVQVESDLI